MPIVENTRYYNANRKKIPFRDYIAYCKAPKQDEGPAYLKDFHIDRVFVSNFLIHSNPTVLIEFSDFFLLQPEAQWIQGTPTFP